MQVSVEATEGLGRRMTVSVPAERIEKEVAKRLKGMAPRVKMDGFRPGKVPMKVVEKRYGPQVRAEVTGEVITQTFYEAVEKESLKPAGLPQIESQNQDAEKIEYTASFEVMPEITLAPMDKVKIERPVAEVKDGDVDDMIEKLREQRLVWSDVKRKAKKGDRVVVDFKGTIDGEVFQGGEGQDMAVTIGSGGMIPGFEEKLVGAKTDEEVAFDISFPEDYHSADVAGKEAHFELKVKKVEGSKLPEVDAEFMKSFGVDDGDMDKFRGELRQNMERELERVMREKVKTAVMDGLLETNPMELPQALIDQEAQRMAEQMNQQMRQYNPNAKGDFYQPELFGDQARRRVALGLLLSELIRVNELKADADKVRAEVEKMASAYEKPEEVVAWYYKNPQQLSEVESMVLENEAVEWVLNHGQVTDNVTTFDALVNQPQGGAA